jgi:hypothetical protein
VNIFITDKKKIKEAEMNKRVDDLKIQVRKFFVSLVDNFDDKKLPLEEL